MNLLQFIGLEKLGLKITVISAIVAASDFLLKKFGGKLPRFIVNYSPLAVAVIGTIIAELIESGQFKLGKEIFYGGVMAYSFGTVISVGVRKLINGETPENALLMLVSGVAENICVKNAGAEYSEIVNILNNLAAIDRTEAKNSITALLKKAAKENVSDAEILAAAEIILLSAQNIIKEK